MQVGHKERKKEGVFCGGSGNQINTNLARTTLHSIRAVAATRPFRDSLARIVLPNPLKTNAQKRSTRAPAFCLKTKHLQIESFNNMLLQGITKIIIQFNNHTLP